MRHLTFLGLAALAPATMFLAGTANAEPAKKCEVTVDRSQAPDTYDVTKQVLENGACICYLYTGPAGQQSMPVENRIKALEASGKCDDAPVQAVTGAYAAGYAAAATATGTGIGLGVAAPAIIAAAAAGVIASSNGNDSPGG